MGAIDRYLGAQMLASSPELMAEYLADREKAQIAQATPQVFGQQPGLMAETVPHQYPMMEGEQPIPGLMDETGQMVPDPSQPGTGLYDQSIPMQQRMLQFNQRLGESGVGAFQDLMLKNMQSLQTGMSSPSNRKTYGYGSKRVLVRDGNKDEFFMTTRTDPWTGEMDTVYSPTTPGGKEMPEGNIEVLNWDFGEDTNEWRQRQVQTAGEKQDAVSSVLSEWKRIDKMKDETNSRESGMAKAQYFYDKIASGEMASGGMRKLLSYIPFTFTEQGQLDEEFNAFAETAARAALKQSGEIRPTDADVAGMKRAMFGIGRDEKVNMTLLRQFMNSIERDEHESYILGLGGDYIEGKMDDVYDLDPEDIQTMMDNHDISRKEVYLRLWKKYTKEQEGK